MAHRSLERIKGRTLKFTKKPWSCKYLMGVLYSRIHRSRILFTQPEMKVSKWPAPLWTSEGPRYKFHLWHIPPPKRSFNEPYPIARSWLTTRTFATKRELTASYPLFAEYGRTCKDIGCMRDEVCVMAEDPCSIYQRDNCGRYPTCAKSHPGGKNAVGLSINMFHPPSPSGMVATRKEAKSSI